MNQNTAWQNRFPFNVLLNTSQSRVVYVLKAVPISLVPALVLSVVIFSLFPDAEVPTFSDNPYVAFFSVVFIAPLVETLLLWFGVTLIRRFTSSFWTICLVSAFAWAVLHSLGAFAHGFTIFWSFIVFTMVFQVWYEISTRLAFEMCFAVHMGQNLIVMLIALLG